MAGYDNGVEKITCFMCGSNNFIRRKAFFPASTSQLHRGVGYIPICRSCVELLYNDYLAKSNNNDVAAMRQICRKLDLYWNEDVYESVKDGVVQKNWVGQYLARLCKGTLKGKSYDDTLLDEGSLWSFKETPVGIDTDYEEDVQIESVDEEIINKWGTGMDASMYVELENRYNYWIDRLPKDLDIDIGTEALLKQICSLEIDINKLRANGEPVDKQVNTLNNLLGSAKLKPTQKNDVDATVDNTPYGVWIQRLENQRPVSDPDPELQDCDGIIKYILTWLYGHLSKMLNIKNAKALLYEQEMDKLRVEHPEYDDEDDEEFLLNVFGDASSNG